MRWLARRGTGVLIGGALAVCLCLGARPLAAQSEGKELLAVLDLEAVGATDPEAQAITERLREILLLTGRVTLVDRSQMEAVLNEQALQQTGCTSQECAVEVGRILGVRKLVAGKVVKVDSRVWLLSALMVDVETAETLKVVSVRHRGDFFDLLDREMASLGAQLMGATASTATASKPELEAQPAKVLAIFPPLIDAGYLARYQGGFTQNLGDDLRGRGDVNLRYSALSLLADGNRTKNLSDVQGIADRSWSGIFSKEPDRDYVLRTAAAYDVDVVVMYRISGQRSGGSFHAYVLDVKRQQVFDEKGDWQIGGWNLAVRGALKRLLDRYVALQ